MYPPCKTAGRHSPPPSNQGYGSSEPHDDEVGASEGFVQPYAVITGIMVTVIGLALTGTGVAGLKQVSIFHNTPKWAASLMTGSGAFLMIGGIAFPIYVTSQRAHTPRQKIYDTWKEPKIGLNYNDYKYQPTGSVYTGKHGDLWMTIQRGHNAVMVPFYATPLPREYINHHRYYPYITPDDTENGVAAYYSWNGHNNCPNTPIKFTILSNQSRQQNVVDSDTIFNLTEVCYNKNELKNRYQGRSFTINNENNDE